MTSLKLLFGSCKRVDDVRDFIDDSGLKDADDVTLSTENIQILSNCFLKNQKIFFEINFLKLKNCKKNIRKEMNQ